MDCNKTNMKNGSTGEDVKTLQKKLSNLGYYNGLIDGSFGSMTTEAVKAYQRKQGLAVDGVVGPVTCKKLQLDTKTSPGNYTIFTNTRLCERQGGNCLGQINQYVCGPHAIKQALRRFGITKYTEQQIAGYAGTTTAGTGHSGLETAIYHIARMEGINLSVEWKNFSDLGSTSKERWRKYGDLMTDEDTAVFHHELYRNQYGHYSIIKQVNTNSNLLIVANSLGSRCSRPAYCGYMENRRFGTQEQYLRGISQKSICIIRKK